MHLQSECKVCLLNQTLNTLKILELDEQKRELVIDEISKILPTLKNITPPEAAQIIYPKISSIVGVRDLYKEKKRESILKAKEILEVLKKRELDFEDRLLFGLKLAVLGNTMDYGAQSSFCIESDARAIFDIDFLVDESALLKERLKNAKNIVYLADNAGENVFDEELLRIISSEFDKRVYYFVRAKPIINDISFEDLEGEIFDIADVVDSGCETPGFLAKNATKEAKEIYQKADLIISKGMGNFETLCDEGDDRIFFIFKVKCDVVSKYIGIKQGSILCMRSFTQK